VIVAETHGFAGLQRIEGAEDGSVAETLGNAAGVKRVEGFGGRVVAGQVYLLEGCARIGAFADCAGDLPGIP
jgi:hypothetical protein